MREQAAFLLGGAQGRKFNVELLLEPPKARYGVISLTLPGHCDKYLEIGPVLAASYNRQVFEVLYPFQAVVTPLAWELHETYGVMDSPDAAIWHYLSHREAELVLSQEFDRVYGERYGGDGAVELEMPHRKIPAAEMEYVLLEREVGA